jgi:hypothetical protein
MNYSFDEWVTITKYLTDYYSEHAQTRVHISFSPFIKSNGIKGCVVTKITTHGYRHESYTFNELNGILKRAKDNV